MTVEKWLYSRVGLNFEPGLHRMRAMLDYFDHPEKELEIIHVTGTNGKGSTIAFMRNLFEAHGLTVGAFTSPHMERIEERISLNGQPIPSQKLTAWSKDIQKAEEVTGYTLSFFEILTLTALLYFREQTPDLVLLEVGIGGLLDTTNVVDGKINLITSVGLDHQETLGRTIQDIAYQKAGIFKKGAPSLVGPLPQKALEVCRAKDPKTQVYGQDFKLAHGLFENARHHYRIDKIGLRGDHQVENAALALQAFDLFMEAHDLPVSEQAVEEAISHTAWWGRLEEVLPGIFLDGAHNLAAIERLIQAIQSEGKDHVKIYFGALRRKDYKPMLSALRTALPEAEITVVGFDDPGSVDSAVEGFAFDADFRRVLPLHALENRDEQTTIYLTGSLYFVSQVRSYLLKN